jgi:hypothetical protein
MCRAPQRLWSVSIVLLLGVAACGSSSLRRWQGAEPELVNLRSEYLAQNPNSPFRENVSRGEIVKGMDVYCVLAAWGPPQHRSLDGDEFQRWLYVDLDESMNQQVGYALEFEDGLLKSWDVHRGSIGLKTRDFTKQPPTPAAETVPGKVLPAD